MSEIKKLYENANIKQDRMCEWTCKDSETCNLNCEHYQSMQLYYPPFTAEKQLLLLQWLLDKTDLYLHRHKTDFTYSIASGDIAVNECKNLEESIAELINAIWQSLTEQEKEQIRDILKG